MPSLAGKQLQSLRLHPSTILNPSTPTMVNPPIVVEKPSPPALSSQHLLVRARDDQRSQFLCLSSIHSHSYTYSLYRSLPDRAYHPRRSKSSSPSNSKIGTSALPRRISSEKKPEPTYDILTQLKKTPAHISLWDLLHSSSKHRDCLLKFLQKVHVSKEVEPEMLDTMINLMKAPKVLSFSDEEMKVGNCDKPKQLNITVQHRDFRVPLVLIDNGSALNVCPLRTATRMGVDPTSFRPSSLIVRAFDNSRREVIGEVDLDITIGPATFAVTFQVLDIQTTFHLLLGRPWIHDARVTLHQRRTFPYGDQIVVVLAEPDPVPPPDNGIADAALQVIWESISYAKKVSQGACLMKSTIGT